MFPLEHRADPHDSVCTTCTGACVYDLCFLAAHSIQCIHCHVGLPYAPKETFSASIESQGFEQSP